MIGTSVGELNSRNWNPHAAVGTEDDGPGYGDDECAHDGAYELRGGARDAGVYETILLPVVAQS